MRQTTKTMYFSKAAMAEIESMSLADAQDMQAEVQEALGELSAARRAGGEPVLTDDGRSEFGRLLALESHLDRHMRNIIG